MGKAEADLGSVGVKRLFLDFMPPLSTRSFYTHTHTHTHTLIFLLRYPDIDSESRSVNH